MNKPKWRVGTKVPVNLYKDDQIAGQCQTPELAAEIVSGMNAKEDLERAAQGAWYLTQSLLAFRGGATDELIRECTNALQAALAKARGGSQ